MGPAFAIPFNIGEGGAGMSDSRYKGIARAFYSIVTDLAEIKAKFDAHKHSFDGTQAADSISGTPVTGVTTGSATGGTASAATIGTTMDANAGDYLKINK